MRGRIALAGLAAAVLAAGVGVVLEPALLLADADADADASTRGSTPAAAVAPADRAAVSLAGADVLGVEPGMPRPVAVAVPAIGVVADLVTLGLEPDGALEVPADPAVAGWYAGGPAPGERGPAVLAGHVDSRRGPGVFFDLAALRPGDEVLITRGDGTVLPFVVDRVERHPKSAFPTTSVYGPVPGPELRLITCGGDFDYSERHYRDNVVVFARMAELARP